MDQVGAAIVNKLSHGELFFIISVLIFAIIYYAPKIRIKKGKDGEKTRIYIYDQKYADQRKDMKRLINAFEEVNERLKGLSVEVLKGNIYNEKLPIKDSLCSGVRYIKAGYNSETKRYIEENLMKKHPKEWAICWDLIQEPNL